MGQDKGVSKIMQVADIGFVNTARIVHLIETQAGLTEINYNHVHSFKVSFSGIQSKKRIKAIVEANQGKLTTWAKGKQRSEEMRVLARSIYLTNDAILKMCDKHITLIAEYMDQVQSEI